MLAIVFLPLLYGFLGFLSGVLGAALYNLLAPIVGGIELEFSGRPPEDFGAQTRP
ncbi:MAG: hypothetical protein IPJ19_11540 [Planctomycetes bacterium]|nr:hypothetical protein [Planctomycetota bacterium]